MAYNPDPRVRLAERLGKEKQAEIVIIMTISNNNVELVGWGKNARLCKEASKHTKTILKALNITEVKIETTSEGLQN